MELNKKCKTALELVKWFNLMYYCKTYRELRVEQIEHLKLLIGLLLLSSSNINDEFVLTEKFFKACPGELEYSFSISEVFLFVKQVRIFINNNKQ